MKTKSDMGSEMGDEQRGRTMRSAASVPNIHDYGKQSAFGKKRSAPMT
jgi:hypothetical protein